MTDPTSLYLDLVKRSVLNQLYGDDIYSGEEWRRIEGRAREDNWLQIKSQTMVGMTRLNNVQWCCERAIIDRIEGDFVECGVWRGGVTILMRAIAKVYSANRLTWAVDSYEGLPVSNGVEYPLDARVDLHQYQMFNVSLEKVQDTFDRYGLLDDCVKFVKGWFKDVLPTMPVRKISVLRADGDLYESTSQVLEYLYPKVERNGFVIIDDYYHMIQAKQATDDYRKKFKIEAPLVKIDWNATMWRKS